MLISPEPETHGLPIPLATTAAWLVMPPLAVNIPLAACIPWMSSGEVSTLTKIVSCIELFNLSASSDVKTTFPLAAPGEAGNPFAITLLKTKDYPTGNLRSKSWDEFSMPNELKLDLVITVCDNAAGEICPVWYGEPTRVHWSIPDPATVLGNDDKKMATFEKVFDLLQTRISALVNLPILEISHSELTDALNKLT